MAFNSIISTIFLLLTTITNTPLTTAVPDREYRSMLAALRLRGYNLFANAITTTDLHYDIITSNNNFTFFAPIDSALYALDMTLSAADYTTVLRFHCVPHRITLTDLRTLFYGSNSVPSLVEGHNIHVVNPLTLRSPIMVEGVDIAVPGLFYGSHVAVHGLEGVMDFRSLKDTINSSNANNNNNNNNNNSSSSNSTRNQFNHKAEIKVESITQPKVISESITQPRKGHMRSELVSGKIHDVSLARVLIDTSIGTGMGTGTGTDSAVREYSEVDDEVKESGIEEGDNERLEVANMCRGDIKIANVCPGDVKIANVCPGDVKIGNECPGDVKLANVCRGNVKIANVCREDEKIINEVYESRNMICVAE